MTGYDFYIVPHGIRITLDGKAVADIRLDPLRMWNTIQKASLEWGRAIAERCRR